MYCMLKLHRNIDIGVAVLWQGTVAPVIEKALLFSTAVNTVIVYQIDSFW